MPDGIFTVFYDRGRYLSHLYHLMLRRRASISIGPVPPLLPSFISASEKTSGDKVPLRTLPPSTKSTPTPESANHPLSSPALSSPNIKHLESPAARDARISLTHRRRSVIHPPVSGLGYSPGYTHSTDLSILAWKRHSHSPSAFFPFFFMLLGRISCCHHTPSSNCIHLVL